MKNDDIRILRDIEQYYSTQIDEMPMNGELEDVTLTPVILTSITPTTIPIPITIPITLPPVIFTSITPLTLSLQWRT